MFLRCGGVLGSTQEGDLHLLDGLDVDASLYTEVGDTEVHVVVLQLMIDVERGIVAGIERVLIQCA